VTDSPTGTRERLVAAAGDLVYRQGVERTTLADIAQAADMRVGNVYYYFKSKDDIVAAIAQRHIDQLEAGFAALERAHRSPRARLKALAGTVAEQAAPIARFGCPYGTLSAELVKRTSGTEPRRLMQALLGWTERQFRAMGRRDARDLAVDFVAAYQGTAVLASALGQPDLLTRQARRLRRWIDTLTAAAEKGSQP
jgi:TetR/AcrR family transcriptional regulator, transcriptional repressor for nem operon